MISANLHPREDQRLAALHNYEILDTEGEIAFDELTELASNICGTPISLISLVDDSRQWFKAKVGLDATETAKSIAFCSHAILQDKVFEINDATKDKRFDDNPLVTGAPDIRFYAGAPLITPTGLPIGTLCVIDQTPKSLTAEQLRALEIISRQVVSQLEVRLNNRRLERINKGRERLFSVVAHDLKTPFNSILNLSRALSTKAEKLSPERIVKSAHQVLSSSLEAYQLLEELLQWSQQQMGCISVNASDELARSLADSCINLHNDALKAKGLELINQLPKDVKVRTDPAIAKTVIRNLIANAIKYSPRGATITIEGTVNKSDEAETPDVIEIAITDQGRGMSKEIAEALFEKCISSEQGTEGEAGHGLGLSLCQQFLAMQNDKIWIDTENSTTTGTRVLFTLRLAEKPQA